MKTILLLLCIYLLSCNAIFAQTTPSDLQDKLKNNIKKEKQFQEKAEAWADQRENLINNIRQQKHTQRWLKYQIAKYQKYIEKQKKTILALELRKKEAEKIKMELEPFLDTLIVKLETLIEQDMPFLDEERKRRIEFLKSSFNDYHIGLDEKARRIFEALQVEANYGKTIEKTVESIQIDNKPIKVNLFRLGRVAMFYGSLDEKEFGWFNPNTKKWETISSNYKRDLIQAMEIAEKKHTPVLLNLPVGEIQK